MVEEKVAMNLVKRALEEFNRTRISPFPAISISKRYYKRYNFDVLNNELHRLNFMCIDQIDAPKPFSDNKDAKKYYLVYQPTKKSPI